MSFPCSAWRSPPLRPISMQRSPQLVKEQLLPRPKGNRTPTMCYSLLPSVPGRACLGNESSPACQSHERLIDRLGTVLRQGCSPSSAMYDAHECEPCLSAPERSIATLQGVPQAVPLGPMEAMGEVHRRSKAPLSSVARSSRHECRTSSRSARLSGLTSRGATAFHVAHLFFAGLL